MNDEKTLICNWCSQPSALIWVHGHGQCSVCGIIIDECCKGEEAHPLTPSLLVRRNLDEDGRAEENVEND